MDAAVVEEGVVEEGEGEGEGGGEGGDVGGGVGETKTMVEKEEWKTNFTLKQSREVHRDLIE